MSDGLNSPFMRHSKQPCSLDKSSFDMGFVEEIKAEDELDDALTFGGKKVR